VVASPRGVAAPTAELDVRHDSTIGPSSQEQSMNSVKVTRNLGMLLLGIWLILSGLIPLLSLSFDGLGTLMAILAIAAGALILVGR
jgi:hypothetical protein